MSWIQTNYYLEMNERLLSAGYTCETKEDAPWYTTNCILLRQIGRAHV